MENSHRCDVPNIDVPGASYAKHVRGKKTFGKRESKWIEYTKMVI